MIRFECGCIGLYERPNPDGEDLIVRHCDGNDDKETYSIGTRNMQKKSFEPVPKEEEEALLRRLSRLVADGHKFHQLQHLLGVPIPPVGPT